MVTHRITHIRGAGDRAVFWRCACGRTLGGYDTVAQARLAAAAHQLPDDVGRQLLTVREQGTTLQAVISEHAEDAARAEPVRWAFWQATADGAEFPPSPAAWTGT